MAETSAGAVRILKIATSLMGLEITDAATRIRMLKAGVAVAAGAAAALVLRRFPPETSNFYPVCPFHQFTGLLCPGCGGTRALAALLHGGLAEAWGDNALVVALLPVLLVYAGVGSYPQLLGRDAVWPQVRGWVVAGLVAGVLGFAIWRNLG